MVKERFFILIYLLYNINSEKRLFSSSYLIRKSCFSNSTGLESSNALIPLCPLWLCQKLGGMKQIGLSRRHSAMGLRRYGRRFSDPSRVNLIREGK